MSPIFFSAASLMIFFFFFKKHLPVIKKKPVFSVMKENKVHRVSLSILKLFISRPNTSLSFSMCVSAVFHGSQYPRRSVCHRALLGFRIPGRRSKGPRIQGPRSQGPRVLVQSPGPRVQGQRVQGLRFQGSRVLVQGPRVQGPGQSLGLKDGRQHGLSLPCQHFLVAAISLQYRTKFFSQ